MSSVKAVQSKNAKNAVPGVQSELDVVVHCCLMSETSAVFFKVRCNSHTPSPPAGVVSFCGAGNVAVN